jgi:hypothetical protein
VKSTGYPLHSPVSPSFPLPVRRRVPSHFNWTLLLQSVSVVQALADIVSSVRSGKVTDPVLANDR